MGTAKRAGLVWSELALMTVVTTGACLGGSAKSGPVSTLNTQIANMPDNTWLRLNPPREPRSRMFSGCCLGDGKLWFFGGGHHAYKYNDVELYDVAANRWDRVTEREAWPEVKGAESMGGGVGVAVPSHALRPLGQHTYQQVCWVPERKRFFSVLVPGTWEFDPATKQWECLAGLHAGKLAGKAGPLAPVKYEKVLRGRRRQVGYIVVGWKTQDGREVAQTKRGDHDSWQTADGKKVTDIGTFSPGFQTGGGLVIYDSVLKQPLCFDGGRAEGRTLWAFNFEKMRWETLMFVAIPRSVRNYAASGLPGGVHLVTASDGKWWLLNPSKKKLKRLEKVPESLQDRRGQSLAYDAASNAVLILARTVVGKEGKWNVHALDVWTFDPKTEMVAKQPTPEGPRPRSRGPIGQWATFWYDPAHNAGIFVHQLGQGGHEGQPCKTWAYRYKRGR